MGDRLTWGFAQVRLDIVSISSSKYPSWGLGWTNNFEHLILTSSSTKINSGSGRTVGQFHTCAKP
jgi:hypothetical protein